jgi:AraC-like DNA-binding protein
MIFAKYYLELNINFKKLSIVINVGIFLGIINLLIVAIFKSARYTPLTISIYLIFYFYLSVYSLYLRIIKNKPIYLYYFFSSFAFFAILIIGFLYVNGITDIAALIGKWSVVIGGILYFVIISIGLTINRSIMLRDLSLLSDQIALRNSKKESVPTATEEKIRKAISFINKNYTHDISREGLAANSDMNTDYFSRAFKIYTGKKINDYINDLRIQNAAHELKNRDKTVINIAFDAGFENLRTFNRAFLKVMGITPSDYRKKHRGLPTAG